MKIRVNLPVIVEGRYDKAKLSGIIDGTILTTEGFGIFKNEEKRSLIKTLGSRGVIILCDSDGGGKIIRSRLKGMLGGINVYNLYIPQVEGKERRKRKASKAGYLGVEGIDDAVLLKLFEDFSHAHPELFDDGHATAVSDLSRYDMFELGLSGGNGSAEARDRIAKKYSLPSGMNANGLYEALVLLGVKKEELRMKNEE